MGNIYHTNDTMKLIGYQYGYPFNKEAQDQVNEIAEARPFSFSKDAAYDLFMLGYIHGKRAERAKRKH